MNNLSTKTIKEIALENPATIRVFQEFKIDFCCGGKRLFDDACRVAGVAPEIVSARLEETFENNSDADFVENKTASELIDYIVEKHHAFTKSEVERLSVLTRKVCHRHGASHNFLFALENSFRQLCEELLPHLQKEEMVLFPYIKRLEMSAANNLAASRPPFGSVNNPVRMMMFEHDAAGEILRKMREITGDYVLPKGACMSFRALYNGLEELEQDLHRHIHLENNVLFPRAVELEKEVFAAG